MTSIWNVRATTDHERVPLAGNAGVTVTRRTLLEIGLVGFGTTLVSSCRGVDSSTGAPRRVGADALVQTLRPLAVDLITQEAPDEEQYLRIAERLLARLDPPAPCKPLEASDGFDADSIVYFPPIALLHIAMAPGSVIHLHDHRDYNGVLTGVRGSALVRNFDLVAADAERTTGEVTLRETNQCMLTPGATSTLARRRDNIHHVVAGSEGAHLVDLFTYFAPDAGSHELDWDERPIDGAERLYRAAWRA
jgi:hypothetical protein